MSPEASIQLNVQELARRWVGAQPVVAAFISLIVRDFHDAQDVLQEVAAAVLSRDMTHQDIPESFNAWVIGIARHKAIDWHRKHTADRMLFDTDALESIAIACEEVGRDYGPRQEALEHCLKLVAGKSKQFVEMRYREDMTPSQIARKTGDSDSAVRVLLHRVRWALRDCIHHRIAITNGLNGSSTA